ncbi:MAG: hypothetical protein M3306_12255 [Actinomycetota bacterium]|nr:hypothetical protein [Actinomycetota bacterium]
MTVTQASAEGGRLGPNPWSDVIVPNDLPRIDRVSCDTGAEVSTTVAVGDARGRCRRGVRAAGWGSARMSLS